MGFLSDIEDVAKSGWHTVSHTADDFGNDASGAWADAVHWAKQAGSSLSDPNSLTSKLGHTALDGVGMIPVVGSVAEGVNAGWYGLQGDYGDAALSAASAIPFAGDAADAVRLGKDGVDLVKDGETAAHVVQDLHTGETAAKGVTTESAKVGRNEASWTLSAEGRPTHVEGTLRESGSHLDRSPAELKAQDTVRHREGAHPDDDAGHIVGHRFMPGQGERNMFPQNFNFNRGAYKKMENEWEAWTKKGGEVSFRTDLEGGTADRPDRVVVEYEVHNGKGKLLHDDRVTFENQAGQKFDRVPTKNMARYFH